MKNKIFSYVIILILFSFIVSNIFSIFNAKKHYNKEVERFLYSIISLLESYPIKQNDDMENYAQKNAELIGNSVRVTLIDNTGKVVGDSDAEYSNMENHLNRPEIIKAIDTGYGRSTRYSTTLQREMLYIAKMVDNNIILRVSIPLSKGYDFLYDMIPTTLFITVLTFILSLIFVNRLTNKLILPFLKLKDVLSSVIVGELDNPVPEAEYPELYPIIDNLKSIIIQIKSYISSIKQQSDKIDYIISNMHEGLIMLDENAGILLINEAAKKFLNIEAIVLEKKISLYIRNDEIINSIKKAVNEKKPSVVDIDSKVFVGKILRFHISPVSLGNIIDNNRGIIILISDVTEIKKAEKVRSDFVANVSHELKTPITTIKGFTELLSVGMVKDADASSRYLKLMLVECERLISLINDILKLSELEDISIYTAKEAVNILDIAYDVKELLHEQAVAKNISVEINGTGGKIHASYDKIKELLINLTENAIKYNNEGGRVCISVIDEENYTKLAVEDTGIGIPDEHQSRVFERFYRVDKGRSKTSGGTGLGLSIVKHIVNLYGGSIKLMSTQGEGTKIELNFPKMS